MGEARWGILTSDTGDTMIGDAAMGEATWDDVTSDTGVTMMGDVVRTQHNARSTQFGCLSKGAKTWFRQ